MKKSVLIISLFCAISAYSQEKNLKFKSIYFNRHDKVENKCMDSVYYTRYFAKDTVNPKEFLIKDVFKTKNYRIGLSKADPTKLVTGLFSYYICDDLLCDSDHLDSEGIFINGIPVGEWTAYAKNGAVIGKSFYDNLGKRTGNWKRWHTNGVLEEDEYYTDDRLNGKCSYYNSDGQLTAVEIYKNGHLADYQLFDGNGNVTGNKETNPNYNTVVFPEFEGGIQELYNFVSKNIQYPFYSQQLGIQGKVIVRFVVDTDGKIDKIDVLQGVNKECDDEAVRVVKLTSGKWAPGVKHNMKVRVFFILPIKFNLLVL